MKRYNKQQVMNDAHRLYKNEFQRRGRSWSECLKAAWRWEKDAVRVREEKAARLDAMIAASWAAHNARKNEKSITFSNICITTTNTITIKINPTQVCKMIHSTI